CATSSAFWWCNGTRTIRMSSCATTRGVPRPVAAPAWRGSDSQIARSCAAGTAWAICAVKPASTASYSPASRRSSRVVAMATGSTCTAAGAGGAACTGATIAVDASNTEPNAAWSSRRGISQLLLEHQPDVVERRQLRGRDQFPAEPAEPVELLADPLRHRWAHHVRGQFHHFVGPLLVHGVSSGSS